MPNTDHHTADSPSVHNPSADGPGAEDPINGDPSATQYTDQVSLANEGIGGLESAISTFEQSIAAKEAALRQAQPSEVANLQAELEKLRGELKKSKADYKTFLSSKPDLREGEGEVKPSKTFDEILRVSEGLLMWPSTLATLLINRTEEGICHGHNISVFSSTPC